MKRKVSLLLVFTMLFSMFVFPNVAVAADFEANPGLSGPDPGKPPGYSPDHLLGHGTQCFSDDPEWDALQQCGGWDLLWWCPDCRGGRTFGKIGPERYSSGGFWLVWKVWAVYEGRLYPCDPGSEAGDVLLSGGKEPVWVSGGRRGAGTVFPHADLYYDKWMLMIWLTAKPLRQSDSCHSKMHTVAFLKTPEIAPGSICLLKMHTHAKRWFLCI